jgi:FAD/FMN-containing dehydrogenase
MQEMSVDAPARVATVSPAVEGQALNAVLQDQYHLMFPSAHGVGIGLGGFCLCGGHGWNSRMWGPGCANLRAVDVIDADGELVHADEQQNTDFLWAARGAGPGYFAAAVRLYLDVHPEPKFKKRSVYVLPMDTLESVSTWVRDHCNDFPKFFEVVLIGRAVNGVPTLIMNGTAMEDDERTVDQTLELLETCPGVDRATTRRFKVVTQLPYRFEQPTEGQPAGYRFAVDNIWTSAPSSELVPLLRPLFTEFPTPKSYAFWQCWGPVQNLKNMAYSVQGDVYLASNAVYTDAADDARCSDWAVTAMRRLDAVSLGAQMNDDDMLHHPARYLSAEAAARLELLRAKYDPEHRFVSFLRS